MSADDRRTVPTTVVDRLFVYGSLRTGEPAHDVIAPFVATTTPATARGSMFALAEGCPGVLADDGGPLIGEVVRLGDLGAALPALDAYEGEDFARVLVEVATADERLWAWMYVLAAPELTRGRPRVDDGDWARHRTAAR